MKFTFKTNKPTCKYKAFDKPSHDIKLKGVVVGSIDNDCPYYIRFMVVKDDITSDGNPNCPWKWVKLTKTSESLDEAKTFTAQNTNTILTKLNIHINS